MQGWFMKIGMGVLVACIALLLLPAPLSYWMIFGIAIWTLILGPFIERILDALSVLTFMAGAGVIAGKAILKKSGVDLDDGSGDKKK